jgi:hypothetical protein
MIEMLGELLRAIFGMIGKKKYDQAGQSIGEAYLSMLRKDSAFFQEIPEDKLTKSLLEDHNYTNQHLEILAELMYAEAELEYAKGNKVQSLPFYRKSLLLFKFVDQAYRTYSSDRIEKLENIRVKILEVNKSL